MFRCALIIVKSALGKSETVKKLPGMYETLEHLKRYDIKVWNSDILINRVSMIFVLLLILLAQIVVRLRNNIFSLIRKNLSV